MSENSRFAQMVSSFVEPPTTKRRPVAAVAPVAKPKPEPATNVVRPTVTTVQKVGRHKGKYQQMQMAKDEEAVEHATCIIRNLIAARAPLEIQSLVQMTEIQTKKLSWRLLCMVQEGAVSRMKKYLPKIGERYFYYLTPGQKQNALKQWGVSVAVFVPDAHVAIIRALYESNDDLGVVELEKCTGLSRRELTWRLTRLVRQGHVDRRKHSKKGGYQYFLNDEQAANSARFCSDLPIRGKRIAEEDIDDFEDDLSEIIQSLTLSEREMGFLSRRKEELQTKLEAERRKVAEFAKELHERERKGLGSHGFLSREERERLAAVHAKALSRSEPSPVVLAERLGFVRKLLGRPALETEHILRDIEKDYLHALALARGE